MAEILGTIVQGNGTVVVTVNNDGIENHTITKTHHNYTDLREAIKEDDASTFLDKVVEQTVDEIVNSINQISQKFGIEVVDGNIHLDGEPMQNALADAIKRMYNEGEDFTPLVLFMENLLTNPSNRSVEQLYEFLNAYGLTITKDGHFLAYKSVKDNYLDKYSGTIDNSPGAKLEMPRRLVSDDPNSPCGAGLHCGAIGYSGPGGWYNSTDDNVILIKVNPRDVVCVPHDTSFQKIRVCKYEVVANFKQELKQSVYSGEVCDEDYEEEESYEEAWDEEPDEIRPEDMLIGWRYKFDYSDGLGDVYSYQVIVESHDDDDIIVCETEDGTLFPFHKEDMSNIEEI